MENKIKNFITNKKNLIYIYMVVITLLSLLPRVMMISFKSWDYTYCIQEWINEIIKKGGLQSLKFSIGNYNIVYMTFLSIITYFPFKHIIMVKGFSIIFDYICAIYSYKIVGELPVKNKKLYQCLVYSVVLFIPTVLSNSSLWGQCDSIYTAFTLISVYYLLKDKIFLSFVFAGLSFSFKLQFVFILPLYLFLYFKKKNISIIHFILIPVITFATWLPAIIAGRSIKSCIMIYVGQTGAQNNILTNNFPNIYRYIEMFFSNQGNVCLIFTVFLIGIILFSFLYYDIEVNNEKILQIALIFLIIVTQFLPYMHERYGFVLEILLCIYVISKKGQFWSYLLITEIAVFSQYLNFLSGINQYYIDVVCFLYFIYSMLFCVMLFRKIINKENKILF